MLGNCVLLVLDNQKAKYRLARGDIQTDSGMAHAGRDVAASLAYIDMVHREYLTEAAIDRFHGRVAEIGPGDNCGVGLLMLADGAKHVDLVDRFYSDRDPAQHAAIYRALIARERGLNHLAGCDREGAFRGIARHYGEAASAEHFFIENRGYDFIVSRAVLEHVSDPILSLQRMRAALNPGGVMIHVVDLRDHGMFTACGFDELKFLEVPSAIYPQMTAAMGRPNRVPLSAFRAACPDATIKVTHLVGSTQLDRPMAWEELPQELRNDAVERVKARKKRFTSKLRSERDEDLAVTGFVLIDRAM
ncbi:class I SAM-dependent methyltransferase [Phenylobacterium soli]|nr:methyltransferase domain-containing protein [Phenylobacterium soli]